jgi:hypothetical protein
MAFPRLILLPDGSPFASEAELPRSRSVSLPVSSTFWIPGLAGTARIACHGNLIDLAVSIADNQSELVMKLLALPIFAAFVACSA